MGSQSSSQRIMPCVVAMQPLPYSRMPNCRIIVVGVVVVVDILHRKNEWTHWLREWLSGGGKHSTGCTFVCNR